MPIKNTILMIFIGFIIGLSKILSGHGLHIKFAAYQASIIKNGSHHCGAAIASDVVIVTAASCCQDIDIEQLRIKFGSNKLNQGQERQVSQVIIHPDFSAQADKDVCCIVLKKSIKFSIEAVPVPLADENAEIDVGSSISVTGWGTLNYFGSDLSQELMRAEIPIVSSFLCNAFLYFTKHTDNMFCAGDFWGGKNSCQGDLGGPALFRGRLVGIVSKGFLCGLPIIPVAYCKVSTVRPFIESIIQKF